MLIRNYRPSDCREIIDLFYNTVHLINAKDYTQEQLEAWANKDINLEQWNIRLQSHYCLVACIDDVIVGFGDIDNTGYLDHLYVHAHYQRQGIASALCDRLEATTTSSSITTHASITARPFFEKRGYKVVIEQLVNRCGVYLTNYVMEKLINR